jgi:DNA-binding transcriptional ArsR family regulator
MPVLSLKSRLNVEAGYTIRSSTTLATLFGPAAEAIPRKHTRCKSAVWIPVATPFRRVNVHDAISVLIRGELCSIPTVYFWGKAIENGGVVCLRVVGYGVLYSPVYTSCLSSGQTLRLVYEPLSRVSAEKIGQVEAMVFDGDTGGGEANCVTRVPGAAGVFLVVLEEAQGHIVNTSRSVDISEIIL